MASGRKPEVNRSAASPTNERARLHCPRRRQESIEEIAQYEHHHRRQRTRLLLQHPSIGPGERR